ncbi:MAG: FtsH protease activity modulator HflK [Myxococcales bacterium]|nr:FtsH protease activity modulator HflK [Myxococcales bacterium]
MEEFDWNEVRDRMPPPERIVKIVIMAIILLVGVWAAATSYYTVDADEEAAVLRFGKYVTTTGPGLHFKAPFNIDRIYKARTQTQHAEEFGFRTVTAGKTSVTESRTPAAVSEAFMLTGDLNLVMVTWEVRYRIIDLKEYLFEVQDVPGTIRDVSLAVMRQEVGNRSVDEVFTLDRLNIQRDARRRMQAMLDAYKAGVNIETVTLKRSAAPEAVQDAFNAVQQAEQEKEAKVNKALGEKQQKLKEAGGRASRMVQEAKGYANARINRAEGEVQAFNQVLGEYEKYKEVTRQRLYFEALEKFLPKVSDVMVIDAAEDGVLKLLDLKKGGK